MSEDWLKRYPQDDRKAFESHWEQFAPKLYTIAYRILGSQADAQEALKKICIRLFRTLPQLQAETADPTRIYGIAVNACMEFLRANGRYRAIVSESAAPDFSGTDVLSPKAALSRKASGEVALALYALPSEYTAVLVLCDMEGLSHKEAALSLGCTLPTVRVRLSRARLLLLSRLCGQEAQSSVQDNLAEKREASVSRCTEFCAALTAYIDGSLPKDQSKKVKVHIENCPSCRRQYDALQTLRHLLHVLPVPPMPDSTASLALEAVKTELQSQKPSLLPRPLFSAWTFLAFAAVCMLVFTIFYSQRAKPARIEQKTNPYIPKVHTEEAAPSVWPRQPFGPYPADAATPTPSLPPASNGQGQPTGGVSESGQAPAAFVPLMPPDTGASAVPYLPYEAAPNTTDKTESATPSQSASMVLPSAGVPTSAPTIAPPPSAAEPSYKTYPTVSSLVKRSITFVVDNSAAQPLFQSAKQQGASAVKNVFYANGISFSTRENVVEEYAAEYNALANEATMLSKKIASGQGGNLYSRLSQTEAAMQQLRAECSTPVLYLAYQ